MEAPGIPLYIGINGNGAVTTIRFPFSMASVSSLIAYVGRTVSFT